eukprot:scaffold11197_cov33-Tisochrysis_lutea.AAC.1
MPTARRGAARPPSRRRATTLFLFRSFSSASENPLRCSSFASSLSRFPRVLRPLSRSVDSLVTKQNYLRKLRLISVLFARYEAS